MHVIAEPAQSDSSPAARMESVDSRQVDMEQLQQAYPARTVIRAYSLIQRMQDKAGVVVASATVKASQL